MPTANKIIQLGALVRFRDVAARKIREGIVANVTGRGRCRVVTINGQDGVTYTRKPGELEVHS